MQLVRSPFLERLIIFPLHHVVDIMLLFQMLVNNEFKMSAARFGSALNNSAISWSSPGALLLLRDAMALHISVFDGSSVSISISVSASRMCACPFGSGLFKTSEKFSFHHSSCSFSDEMRLPCLSFTCMFVFLLLSLNFLTI